MTLHPPKKSYQREVQILNPGNKDLDNKNKTDSSPFSLAPNPELSITGMLCSNFQPVKDNFKYQDDHAAAKNLPQKRDFSSTVNGNVDKPLMWGNCSPKGSDQENEGADRSDNEGTTGNLSGNSYQYSDYLPGAFMNEALGSLHFPGVSNDFSGFDLSDPLFNDVWINDSHVLTDRNVFTDGAGTHLPAQTSPEFLYLPSSLQDVLTADELFYDTAFRLSQGGKPSGFVKDPHDGLRGRSTPSTIADCSNGSESLSPSSAFLRPKATSEASSTGLGCPTVLSGGEIDVQRSKWEKFGSGSPPVSEDRMMIKAGSNEHCRRTPVKGWWKTEMCKFWVESHGCRNGVNCRWAHGLAELRNTNVRESRVTPPIASPFLLSAAVAAKVQGAAAKQPDDLNRSCCDEWDSSEGQDAEGCSKRVANKCRDTSSRYRPGYGFGMSFSSRMSSSLDCKLLSLFHWIIRPADEGEILKRPGSLMMLWNYIRDQEVKPMKLAPLNFSLEFWSELSEAWCPFILSESPYGTDVDKIIGNVETCGLCSGVFLLIPVEGSARTNEPFCPVCPECRDMMIAHMQESRLAKFWNVEMWNLGVSLSSCPWQPYLLEYIRSIDILYKPKLHEKRYNPLPRTVSQLCFNRLSFALNLLCNQLPTAERTLFMTSFVTPKLPLLNWAVFNCHPLLFTVLLRNAFPIPLASLPKTLKDELKSSRRQTCGDAARSDVRPRFSDCYNESDRLVPAPPLITPS